MFTIAQPHATAPSQSAARGISKYVFALQSRQREKNSNSQAGIRWATLRERARGTVV